MSDVMTESESWVLAPSRDLQSNWAYEKFTVQNSMCQISYINKNIKEEKKTVDLKLSAKI